MVKWAPDPRTPWQAAYVYSWLAALYVCLTMVALLVPLGLVARMARWRFLQGCGRVSYCLYLTHLAALGAFHWGVLRAPPRINDWRGALTTLVAAAFAWTIAHLSGRFFEKPLIARGHAFRFEEV